MPKKDQNGEQEVITSADVGELKVVDPHACHALHGAQTVHDVDIFCAQCQAVTKHKLSAESLSHVQKMNHSARAGLARAVAENFERLKAEGKEAEHVEHAHIDREPEFIATCDCGRALKFPMCSKDELAEHLDRHHKANVGQITTEKMSEAEKAHDARFRKLMGISE